MITNRNAAAENLRTMIRLAAVGPQLLLKFFTEQIGQKTEINRN